MDHATVTYLEGIVQDLSLDIEKEIADEALGKALLNLLEDIKELEGKTCTETVIGSMQITTGTQGMPPPPFL